MPAPTERRLEVGDVRLDLDVANGGRATSWQVAGQELLAHHGDAPEEHGMYAMAPWAGRLRDNSLRHNGSVHAFKPSYGPWAIHGLAVAAATEILEEEAGEDFARVVLRVDHDPGWPWSMAIDVVWELAPRLLTTSIIVHAFENEFPAVVGWHPWFRRGLDSGGALEWNVDADLMIERGDDHLPTGQHLPASEVTGPFDDAFHVPSGTAVVRWPGVLTIDIVNDHPWFVVFDQLPDAVCLEPQSGPPNGINDGLGEPIPIAAPGRPHVMTTEWRISDDLPAAQA